MPIVMPTIMQPFYEGLNWAVATKEIEEGPDMGRIVFAEDEP